MGNDSIKIIQKNRKAFFSYEILEKYEAGLALKGTEVKSIRQGTISIAESYARSWKGEMYIYNMDISSYQFTSNLRLEPKRPRKLLMRKKEINKLISKTQEKGLTLIPLSLYFKNGYAKLELGLGRGKKLFDKRESLKKKDAQRELARVMKKW
ncbi:MAG: SsrA-binding protein SmpB [Planctomycetota bacterium]